MENQKQVRNDFTAGIKGSKMHNLRQAFVEKPVWTVAELTEKTGYPADYVTEYALSMLRNGLKGTKILKNRKVGKMVYLVPDELEPTNEPGYRPDFGLRVNK